MPSILQSTGACGPQEGSLGLELQSTGPPGVILHDGSFGLVLQSIGHGGGGGGSHVEPKHSGTFEC
jgi:hypothetical protein